MARHSKPDVLKLTIFRDIWKRGRGAALGSTALLNMHGMCCLGFMSMAAGVRGADMAHVDAPRYLDFKSTRLPLLEDMVDHGDGDYPSDTAFSTRAIANNDKLATDDEIEESLIKLFAEIGTTLTFEDTAPDEFRADYEEALS